MNMLGIDNAEELTDGDTCDAIGEITNMIMGGVKSRLLDDVGSLEVSIPSVVSGRDLKNNLGDAAEKVSVKVNIENEHVTELLLLYRESKTE